MMRFLGAVAVAAAVESAMLLEVLRRVLEEAVRK